MSFIPVNEPLLKGNEKKYLNECIDTGWISSEGPFVSRLEHGMAQYTGRNYGISVCNGTAALDVAVAALGIGQGDEVIMPTFTIISCASAIVRAGAIPVLVDSTPDTWCMDVTKIEEKITPKTRAIMVVHIYGLPVDMDPVMEIARKHNIKIIEDAAESHGLEYKGKKCGSFGDISTFSFYPNKHITTGEGGMVLTNSVELAEKCRSLRNLCFQTQKRFLHEELGWNYRMSNLQAAVGVAQLEKLEEFIQKKKEMGKIYTQEFSGIEKIILPVTKTDYAENIYWVFGILLKDTLGMNAEEAMQKLKEKGIGTRPFFYPMHRQPVFNKMGLFKNENYPESERLAEMGFYIPSGLGLTQPQMQKVIKEVKGLFNEY